MRGGLAARRLVGLAAAVVLSATASLEAQQIVEYGPQVTGVAADPASAVAGGHVALRSLGRTRFVLSAAAGVAEGGETAGRAELAVHFLLNPRARAGLAAYVGGGAAVADAGDGANGYLVLLAGLERSPGSPSGWFLEAGLGGGVRLAAGWRWRSFPPNWRFRR